MLEYAFLNKLERLAATASKYLAVGECMHSQIWNNSGSDGSINVIFCEWIEQILNNYFMKFYQICVWIDKMTALSALIV